MLTERARLAVLFAEQEARGMDAPAVGPLHLLCGLMLEDEGRAADLLTNHGVRLEALRAAAAEGAAEPAALGEGDPPLSPAVERVLERAEQEARWLERDHVGTEHVLLGLLHEGQGEAIRLLLDAGLAESEIRDELVRQARRRR
ncbi:MAG TPA: Clp protease N-terminal domain-containing protein [Solirubrobacteraceae bacterium]|jgi:ATP-dependent Clp protease ATP-binding subunit ClpC